MVLVRLTSMYLGSIFRRFTAYLFLLRAQTLYVMRYFYYILYSFCCTYELIRFYCEIHMFRSVIILARAPA